MGADFELAQAEIEYILDQWVSILFPRGMRITLVVRDPGRAGVALLFGNDEMLKKILSDYFAKKEGSHE